MIHDYLVRHLGRGVQPIELDPALGMALQEALGASRSDPGGLPVVLVHPAPGGAADALYVVQAGRLADLIASSLAAEAGIVRRIRRLIRKEQANVVLPGTRPSEPLPDPGPGPGGDWVF